MDYREPDSHDLENLRQLDELSIRFLWYCNWYDGPLSGMAEYEGRRTWYDFHSDTDDGRHYRYVLYPLTHEQIETAELWHATLGHWDAVASQWVRPSSASHDASWAGPDFSKTQPIGWFADGRNEDFYAIKVRR